MLDRIFQLDCTVPASPYAIVIAAHLILRLHAARSGIVATFSHNQGCKTTTP
jgi:hypothetical protein